jgi:hypothetical protein
MGTITRVLILFLVPMQALTAAAATTSYEPRVIIGVYDAPPNETFESSYLYGMAEFPLNHLGLELEYHNARKTLPDLSRRQDVRGVLVWLIDADKVDGMRLAAFVEAATARGLPVLVSGPLPAKGGEGSANRIFKSLGLRNLGGFRPYTYDMAPVHKVAAMVEFERRLPIPLVPIDIIQAIDPQSAAPYLTLQRGADPGLRRL